MANTMKETLSVALNALNDNKLNTALTIALIAVGITSLTGIQTAVDIMMESIAGTYKKMGATMFTITGKTDGTAISLAEAEEFRRTADFADIVSISRPVGVLSRISLEEKATDPVISILETDWNYILCQGVEIEEGRNLSSQDYINRRRVAIIGSNVKKKLFGDLPATGRTITSPKGQFVVAGVLERQGALFGTSLDNSVLIPLSGDGVAIDVIPREGVSLDEAVKMSASGMRAARRTKPSQEADFEIVRSNTIEDNFLKIKEKLSIAALVIGLITLFGASAGLMNIMLVSVKRRKKEIGIRKAVGATRAEIASQFLTEAAIIGQAGAIAGILTGIPLGNVVALLMDGDFTIPWKWIAVSIIVCLAISMLSGSIPAKNAAGMDPVIALKDE